MSSTASSRLQLVASRALRATATAMPIYQRAWGLASAIGVDAGRDADEEV